MHRGILQLRGSYLSCRGAKVRRTCSSHRLLRASAKDRELPETLTSARKQKATGLVISLSLLASALITAKITETDLILPDLPSGFEESLSTLSLLLLLTLASTALWVAQKVARDRMIIELHNGRLYVQLDVPPSSAPSVEVGSIEVRPSPGKGNGAFAVKSIPKGTYIGDYEGEMLDEVAYWSRYPSGVADYCMGVDREWTIDGRERAKDTSAFSPCHMNHSSSRHNIARRCSRSRQTVSFFASQDIQAGDELLLDYGELYWRGRGEQKLD